MPSKIDWCDETINPQGWGCWGPDGTPEAPQPCWYCYAERQANGPYVPDCELCRQFIPHWHEKRLEKPYLWKKPRRIFWQSMGDLFHPCTPEWQIQVIQTLAQATPQHTHIFCTKNPARYAEFNPWPGNCWLLTTITGYPGIRREEDERVDQLKQANCRVRGLSIEPLLGEPYIKAHFYDPTGRFRTFKGRRQIEMAINGLISWLIIGAYTGKGASRFIPAPAWVQSLIDQGRAAGVPVFLKKNLHWPEKIQEFPRAA